MIDHPLQKLEGLPLGALSLRVSRIEPMRMSGWRRFSVRLFDPRGRPSDLPVMDGIFSSGGKGVQPWIEIAVYHPAATFGGTRVASLREGGLEPILFRYLHDILRPGSHIMLWYEGESGRKTDLALARRVPPLITPLGSILFEAGFISVRDFHLPEGGHEGGRKLWGERPLNGETEIELHKRAFEEVMTYFLGPVRIELLDMELDAREKAIHLIERSHILGDRAELYGDLREAFDRLKAGEIPLEAWPGPIAGYRGEIHP